MCVPVFQLWPDLGHEKLNLFRFPFEGSRQKCKGDALQTFKMCTELEFCDLFEIGILRPWIAWGLEDKLDDIFESSFLKPSSVLIVVWNRSVVFLRGFTDYLRPVLQATVFCQGAVVGVKARIKLLELEIAARLAVSISRLV